MRIVKISEKYIKFYILKEKDLKNSERKPEIDTFRDSIKSNESDRDTKCSSQVKAVIDTMICFQSNHEQMCAENKNPKTEKESLIKELNSTNVSLKSNKKESNDNTYKFPLAPMGVLAPSSAHA